ncbi:DUF1972 domain-containing protein [Vibrio sp. Vb339]|uniref:DUF1972 domain-containing protein n=1 Tax=Vibrio sp. Vb339 TaxID=1192013 RepID=UPI00346444A6
MKVAVVGTVGLPACYGGWETLVENLVNYGSENIKYTVYCSSKNYEHKLIDYNGASLIYLPISANGKSSIIYDVISLVHTWFTKPDVVLVLGVSGCVFLPFYKLFSNSKVIVNVDGIEWRRDKWSGFAKRFLKFSEKVAVKYSDVVLSDNKGIQEYLNEEYGVEAQVIAYGGDHAIVSSVSDKMRDYYFSVCRIEPENNIEMILTAFSQSSKNIKIVGNWSSSQYGVVLREKFSKYENIEMIDPIYDLSTLFSYRDNCCGYIHGHSVGGTNPSLVEIMHFGKNIFAFDCNFNRYTTDNQALYFTGATDLLGLLNSTEVKANKKMIDIARREYTWEIISDKYESTYR